MREMIEGIKIVQLVTVGTDKVLRSRPMATQETEFDGDLWFFTSKDTHKVDEITAQPEVCVTYSAPDINRYVSVSGRAEMVDDAAKKEEFWSPTLKLWFPEGLGDPNLTLIKVTVTRVEYWDAPAAKVVTLVGFIKALAGGNREADEVSQNEEIVLRS